MEYSSILFLVLLLLPALGALLCSIPALPVRVLPTVSIGIYAASLLVVSLIAYEIVEFNTVVITGFDDWFRLDSLNFIILFLLIISCLGVALSAKLRSHSTQETRSPHKIRRLYQLFHLLNIGLFWVLIAAGLLSLWAGMACSTVLATLGSFLLTSPDKSHRNTLLLQVIGLALALLGTLFYLWAASKINSREEAPLAIKFLLDTAPRLDDLLIKFGFFFLLFGYGTQAGLWPAHALYIKSQSKTTPSIGLFFTTVFSLATLYPILRTMGICARVTGLSFPTSLVLLLSLLSLLSTLWILRTETDLKRILLLLTLFHTSLVLLAIGLGTRFSAYSGMHLLIGFTLARACLFLILGQTTEAHEKEGEQNQAIGLRYRFPILGLLFLLFLAAALSLPPFGTFLGQWSLFASIAQEWKDFSLLGFLLIAGGVLWLVFRIFVHFGLRANKKIFIFLLLLLFALRFSTDLETNKGLQSLAQWDFLWFLGFLLIIGSIMFFGICLFARAGIQLVFGPPPEDPITPEKPPLLLYVTTGAFLFLLLLFGLYFPENIDGILDQSARLVLGQAK